MTPSMFHLRPALPGEGSSIAEIWHSSASLPGVGPEKMPTRAQMRERIDRELATGWVVTVAARGEALVGFVAIKPRESVLDQIFVRPDAIGTGVGQALLDHAKAAMPGGFTLFTRSANVQARRFYERAGLVAFREGLHPRNGDPIIHYGWEPLPGR